MIVLPLVIFVLGPNMPPGKGTSAAKGQQFDNVVLLVVMTPITMFILVFIGYAIATFRVRKGDTDPAGRPARSGATCRRRSPG